jgi:hypothetical protein
MVDQPWMTQAKETVVKKAMKQLNDIIDEHSILDGCDSAGITQKGYDTIFRTVKNRVGLVAPGYKSGILPMPHHLSKLRKQMNANLSQFIGDYHHIEGRRDIPVSRGLLGLQGGHGGK